MLGKFRVAGLAAAGLMLLFSAGAWAQTSEIEGVVKGPDGQPLKGAKILIERKDIKATYKGAKTDKKGHYVYNGLPAEGTFKVSVLQSNGEPAQFTDGVTLRGGPAEINFDLKESANQQAAKADAAEAAQDETRGMSKEQKAALEKRKKETEQINAKNKALNDAFNAGMQALQAKQYDAAIEAFKKAGEMDATQSAVWAQLATAYSSKADTEKAADQQAQRQMDLQSSADAYAKAVMLKPGEASLHLNLALVDASLKKMPEAQAELEKAAQLDPTQAGKAYYNLGAILINSGQTDAAVDALQKAIKLDPTYADAYYQYGVTLMAKMQVGADGKPTYAPGTKEAFEKYLELKPDGPNAETAKSFLQSMGETVQTKYSNPNEKKSRKK